MAERFDAVSRSHASHGAEKSSPPGGFDRGELLKLAERCEAATGPDCKLDAEIALRCQSLPYVIPDGQIGLKEIVQDCDGTLRILWAAVPPLLTGYASFNFDPLPVTASLDAAMALVPEGWDWLRDAYDEMRVCPVALYGRTDYASHDVTGKNEAPTLALCAAALRARAA